MKSVISGFWIVLVVVWFLWSTGREIDRRRAFIKDCVMKSHSVSECEARERLGVSP